MIWIEAAWRSAGVDVLAGEPDWNPVPRVQAAAGEQPVFPDLAPGLYQMRARQVDDATGEVSEWAHSEIVAVEASAAEGPFPPVNLRVCCNDLLWDDMLERTDLRGYLVRSNPEDITDWGTAVPCHDGVWQASPLPLCTVPNGNRTFLVRAVDRNGVLGPIVSLNLSSAILGPFDDGLAEELQVEAEAPTFGGDIVGGSVVAGVLTADSTTEFWSEDEAPFWGPDAEEFWGEKGETLVYTTEFTFDESPEANLDGRVLTAAVTTTGRGWRLEIVPEEWDGDEFWEADGDPFWGEDYAEFWPGGLGIRWPGRVSNLRNIVYRIRLVIPGQYPPAEVSVLSFRVTRPLQAGEPNGLAMLDGNGDVVVPQAGEPDGLATLDAAGKVVAAGVVVSGTQVVGARGGAIADANITDLAEVGNRLNTALARLRAHGLIDP